MKTHYGHFDDIQIKEYKVKLHKQLFWLLLLKDPETKDKYKGIDYSKYFNNLMRKIDGLNELLFYPIQIVDLMANLEAAYLESKKENFNYRSYRHFVRNAEYLIDEEQVPTRRNKDD